MKQLKHASTYNPQAAIIILRLGLVAVFAYAALDAFKDPNAWVSYVPAFSNKFIAAKTALDLISVTQLVLVLWLLWGKYLRYASLVAIAFLAGLLVFNLDTFLITFRDLGLIAAAGALFFLSD